MAVDESVHDDPEEDDLGLAVVGHTEAIVCHPEAGPVT